MSINELLFKTPSLKFLDVGGNIYDRNGIISLMSGFKLANKALKILNLDDPIYIISDQPFFKLLLNTELKNYL